MCMNNIVLCNSYDPLQQDKIVDLKNKNVKNNPRKWDILYCQLYCQEKNYIFLQCMPQACVSRSACPITVTDLMPKSQSLVTPTSASRVCISSNHQSENILKERSLPRYTGASQPP